MQNISKRTLGVVGIGLGVMVLGMLWSIVNTALASIQKDLSASVLQLQWMMTAFGICLCVPLLSMGKLGDAYGRKKLFLCGLAGAFVASLVAGFATHVGLLIGCMGLFGLSGSIILPLSQALLVHQFPENQKEKAVGLWSIFASLSLAGGPLVGGILLNVLGWRWVFWINVPVILFTIVLVFRAVRKEKKLDKPRCDWVSVGLLALVVVSLVLAIMQGPNWGWGSFSIIGLFLVALAALSIFIRIEKKTKVPLFRPDLFAQPSFLCSAIPNACMIGFIWVVFFLIPLYLQNMLGYSALHVGVLLLLVTIPVATLSVPITRLYKKWGAKPLLFAGFSLLALSSLMQVFCIESGSIGLVGLGCLGIGLGWVAIWGPSISCALSSIPHRQAGIASGMFTTLQEVGAVTSLAIAGALFRSENTALLSSKTHQIRSALQEFSSDQIASLVTNPKAVEASIGKNSLILPWLRMAFLESYQRAFWFLFFLCLFALAISFFLPKIGRKKKST